MQRTTIIRMDQKIIDPLSPSLIPLIVMSVLNNYIRKKALQKKINAVVKNDDFIQE